MPITFDLRPPRERRRFTIGRTSRNAVRFPAKGRLVTSSLTLVEGVHFDMNFASPREIGHKCLAMALSDLAAAGAVPRHCLLTVGLRQETSEPFVMELEAGARELAQRHGVAVAFAPPVDSPTALLVSLTAVGTVRSELAPVSGARPGDLLAVTGFLGASAAGLKCLRLLGRHEMRSKEDIILPYLMPQPRVAEAQLLLGSGAVTAVTELADGLAADAHGLANASEIGLIIDESLIPVAESTRRAGDLLTQSVRGWTLYGAEDLELLVTLSPKRAARAQAAMRRAGFPFTVVGEVTDRRYGVRLRETSGDVVALQPKLWHPFVRRRKVG